MKRKLICLVMGILMLLTCVLTACSSKETTEDTESAIVSDSGARTITMWVMTDPTTTPEAMKAVNEEFSKITKTQFKTNVELRFCTEEFYWKYDAKTGEWIVENHGVDPDILIDNDPIKEFAGEDEQLNKAIEVALEQIKNRKPLPKTPAPRTIKDLGW